MAAELFSVAVWTARRVRRRLRVPHRAGTGEGGAAVSAIATYLLGALGGWCLRMIWVEIRQLRRETRQQ